MTILGARTFTMGDQVAFAELSGDSNPLHVDALAARRLLYGQPVVHGVHLLLWALEALLAHAPGRINRLKADFLRPIGVGIDVEARLQVAANAGGPVRVQLFAGDAPRTELAFELEADGPSFTSRSVPLALAAARLPCRPRPWSELVEAKGTLPLYVDLACVRAQFPRLLETLSPVTVAELLATTRLVGMECPGERSLYTGLDLSPVPEEANPTSGLEYAVAKADPRFNLLQLRVSGPTLRGTIDTLYRPEPARQLDAATARGIVAPGEFRGQRVLVVGGSRGLGEVDAQLLAAGGARVVITYKAGRDDAERIIQDIHAHGGSATAIELDVLGGPDSGKERVKEAFEGTAPSQLHYYASPFIFERGAGNFDETLFRRFAAYFVAGFAHSFALCRHIGAGRLDVLYPSTVALDGVVRGLAEYTAAKAAGESLCRHLVDSDKNLRLHMPRLPRLRTDQTATIARVQAAEPVEILLPILRKMARGD